MIREYLTFFIIFSLFAYLLISGELKRRKDTPVLNISSYYIKEIIFIIILLLLFYLINHNLYRKIDFSTMDKGFYFDEIILAAILPIFTVSFFLACLPFLADDNIYPKKNISEAKEIFGFRTKLMPDKYRQIFPFFIYITIGVLFEELFCRQFMFYSLHQIFNLDGDFLVLLTALLFGAAHFYQGIKGILSNFFTGFILGKIFLITENFIYPFGLHLSLNLTIVVYAIRRIYDIRKLEKRDKDGIKQE